MTTREKIRIDTPKTFVVISSSDTELAAMVAMSLTADKQRLHNTFGGRALPQWMSMTNHLGGNVKKGEILSSMEAVLSKDENFMMVLSGYEDNDEWNGALKEFLASHDLSATMVLSGGEMPPDDIKKRFHASADVGTDDKTVLPRIMETIVEARNNSSIPIIQPENLKGAVRVLVH